MMTWPDWYFRILLCLLLENQLRRGRKPFKVPQAMTITGAVQDTETTDLLIEETLNVREIQIALHFGDNFD